MSTIAIEIGDQDLQQEIEALTPATVVRGKSLDGTAGMMILVISLAPAIIKQLAAIVTSALERNKHIRLVYDGIEVQGVSEDALLEIIEASRASANPTSQEPARPSMRIQAPARSDSKASSMRLS